MSNQQTMASELGTSAILDVPTQRFVAPDPRAPT